jgi:hypothetical protein
MITCNNSLIFEIDKETPLFIHQINNPMRIIAALFVLFVFAACTTPLYIPADKNVNKVQTASLAELKQGYEIYKSSCGNCHMLFKPDSHSAVQWTKILETMGPKAKLSTDKVDLVYKYLVNH